MPEEPSATVPTAKQAEEAVLDLQRWAEPEVWTRRMLTALVSGVKGGCWFSLIDKVYTTGNLESAFDKVKANKGAPGVDKQTIETYKRSVSQRLEKLRERLRKGEYRPKAVRRVQIPKPGSKETRPLGIPTVEDRIVQTGLRNVLEPIFDRGFAKHSYGFRPGRGCKDALRRVDQLLREGYTHVVDADLKSYFDTIDHDKLMELVERKVTDSRVLKLLRAFLEQEVMEDLKIWTPERGSPQGAVISPMLSNIYLDPLDHLMEDRGYEMVRYADDFVVLCRSEQEAIRALEEIRQWTDEALLTLHPTKTRIVDVRTESFAFLGYDFRPKGKWPRRKSVLKLRDTVRGRTRRTDGRSLSAIIDDLNPVIRGWFEYFKHSHRSTFRELDSWVRMRLRSILRRRKGGRGRGRGVDHQRWPNRFFAAEGLFTMQTAHQQLVSALKRGTH